MIAVNENISAAILYIMFAIAYFVTTTTCLSGATQLKRRACSAANEHASADGQQPVKAGQLTELSGSGTTATELSKQQQQPATNSKASSGKKQGGAAKRASDLRKSGSNASLEKKLVQQAPPIAVLRTRQKKNYC